MSIWLNNLNTQEKQTMAACFGGWALDAFDVQIYSFVIPALIAVWGLTKADAGILGTTALLFSALGGLVGGVLSDRFGRVRTLQVTIIWFSLFTFLSGYAQSFEQLLILRSLQGFGFGAEWAAGAVLMSEVVRSEYRGRAAGVVHSGFAVGWAAAAILYYVVFSHLEPASAWRAMFMIGAAPALFIIFIRRNVKESEAFTRKTATDNNNRLRSTFETLFTPPYLRTTLMASLFSVGLQGGYYAVVTWLPTYLATTKGLSLSGTTGYLIVIIAGAFLGFISGGYISDKIGRRPTFLLFAILSCSLVATYMLADLDKSTMLFMGFPLGFCANAMFGPTGAFYAELFPTEIRGTGQGFCYNVGRGIGALFPALIGFLSTTLPLGTAIGLYTVGAYAIAIIALIALPETRARNLACDTVASVEAGS
ncbi:MFS transporter [Pseudomonas typographi]|uniref:MFS transporter n=1 Tax=Pseudomonas typographi TaxID=2715964 RepID=UPI0016857DB8|nr:MFS transporter [Pseudomonas typographi]MBD1554471.1 MFS transporter [Pseudomonas typographi]